MSAARGSYRLTYLDGLRGVAALVVVLAHFFQFFLPATFDSSARTHGFGEKLLATTPTNLLVSGVQAVSIFFVLSGLVLSAPIFAGKGREWYAEAALKRYPRLAIPALASTLLALLIATTIGFHYGDLVPLSGATMRDRFATIDSLSTAIWQGTIGAFFKHEDSYNPVLWTISIELIGSFMVFATMPIVASWRFRWIVYLIALVATENTHFMGFVVGAVIADALYSGAFRNSTITAIALLVPGIWLGSYPYYGSDHGVWLLLPEGRSTTYHVIGSGLLVLSILMSRRAQEFLSSKPLAFLGHVSYSLYLTHFSLLGSIGALSILLASASFGYQMAVIFTFFWIIPTTIFAAAAFKKLIDDPAIRISGFISQKMMAASMQLLRLRNETKAYRFGQNQDGNSITPSTSGQK
jgi:peptidoglycan/LPS O-acetylase OafA/YrhL